MFDETKGKFQLKKNISTAKTQLQEASVFFSSIKGFEPGIDQSILNPVEMLTTIENHLRDTKGVSKQLVKNGKSTLESKWKNNVGTSKVNLRYSPTPNGFMLSHEDLFQDAQTGTIGHGPRTGTILEKNGNTYKFYFYDIIDPGIRQFCPKGKRRYLEGQEKEEPLTSPELIEFNLDDKNKLNSAKLTSGDLTLEYSKAEIKKMLTNKAPTERE